MNDTGNNLCHHLPNNYIVLPFVLNGDKEDSTPAIDYFLLLYAPLTTLNACLFVESTNISFKVYVFSLF